MKQIDKESWMSALYPLTVCITLKVIGDIFFIKAMYHIIGPIVTVALVALGTGVEVFIAVLFIFLATLIFNPYQMMNHRTEDDNNIH